MCHDHPTEEMIQQTLRLYNRVGGTTHIKRIDKVKGGGEDVSEWIIMRHAESCSNRMKRWGQPHQFTSREQALQWKQQHLSRFFCAE